ncbi:hypothetical protein [Mesorhizobium sp.]|uniref:hypothetical protein n=1 Tax=Mesorhizobium sp. TaxID=1871066 RepID=UPI0025F2FEF8|nr:hypothetical protein [Mesorhizobium sp.]
MLRLLRRWHSEAIQAGHEVRRIVVAYEAGRDGFWLARWLQAHAVEAYVLHPSSVAVSREHRRANTDRLDTELPMRAFLGWLRGEKRHCSMAAIPTINEEEALSPNRERDNLVRERTRIVNPIKAILARFGIRTFKPNLKLEALRMAEGMPCQNEAEPSCAVISDGFTCCVNKCTRSNRSGCGSSRSFRTRRRVRSQWFAFFRGSSVSVSRLRTCW